MLVLDDDPDIDDRYELASPVPPESRKVEEPDTCAGVEDEPGCNDTREGGAKGEGPPEAGLFGVGPVLAPEDNLDIVDKYELASPVPPEA